MRCHENRTGVSSSSTTLTVVDGTLLTCGLCVWRTHQQDDNMWVTERVNSKAISLWFWRIQNYYKEWMQPGWLRFAAQTCLWRCVFESGNEIFFPKTCLQMRCGFRSSNLSRFNGGSARSFKMRNFITPGVHSNSTKYGPTHSLPPTTIGVFEEVKTTECALNIHCLMVYSFVNQLDNEFTTINGNPRIKHLGVGRPNVSF